MQKKKALHYFIQITEMAKCLVDRRQSPQMKKKKMGTEQIICNKINQRTEQNKKSVDDEKCRARIAKKKSAKMYLIFTDAYRNFCLYHR